MILAGDIGGTNTRLALFELENGRPKQVELAVFFSREYGSLDVIVQKFLKTKNYPVECACFGVAGPVRQGRVATSNLAWIVDAAKLKEELSIEAVELFNDLEASAYGISLVQSQEIVVLNEGVPDATGTAALISAGTGLGEAGLHWEGDYYKPFPSEGGHADFGPNNELEGELLIYLLKEYKHVSYERVLSGPGLYNIYRFLKDTKRGDEPEWLAEEINQLDPSVVISREALKGNSKLCVQALDIFVSVYGAEAGNLALKFLATGGVYVGGGIAPKIIEKLKDSTFMNAFIAKGRMRSLLQAIPVRVIMNDRTALLGAARYAAMRISGT